VDVSGEEEEPFLNIHAHKLSPVYKAAYKTYHDLENRLRGLQNVLADRNQLLEANKRTIESQANEIEDLRMEVSKLQSFKDFTEKQAKSSSSSSSRFF
jgi:cell division protein FtsB